MNVHVTAQLVMRNLISGAIVMAIVVALGLYFASKVSLGAPLLVDLLSGKKVGAKFKKVLLFGVPAGALVATVIVLLQIGLNGGKTNFSAGPPAWQGFLACFYGGIAEELECRLLVMSFIVWICTLIRRERGNPSASTLWMSNIIAAIGFGAAHLPAASHLMTLNTLSVLGIIIPNALCGIVFGYFFFAMGLEAAMVSHFSADIMLHVIPQLFMH